MDFTDHGGTAAARTPRSQGVGYECNGCRTLGGGMERRHRGPTVFPCAEAKVYKRTYLPTHGAKPWSVHPRKETRKNAAACIVAP